MRFSCISREWIFKVSLFHFQPTDKGTLKHLCFWNSNYADIGLILTQERDLRKVKRNTQAKYLELKGYFVRKLSCKHNHSDTYCTHSAEADWQPHLAH